MSRFTCSDRPQSSVIETNFQTIAVEILFCLRIKMNDFTQNVKYKAPDILRNNLDRFAQKLEVKRVPEAKPPITLKPLKKNQTDYDI